MKHLILSASVAAALVSIGGVANAQALQPSAWAGATTVLHISGATAPQQTLAGTIENSLCNGTFVRLTNLTGGSTSVSGQTLRQMAWGCTTTYGTTVIYYTTTGSNYGVQPAIQGTALPRLNQAGSGCPTTVTLSSGRGTAQCTAIVGGIPDVGVSDIDPRGFVNVTPDLVSVNNVPNSAQIIADYPDMAAFPAAIAALETPYTEAQRANITVSPIQGVIFGLVASNPLVLAAGGTLGTDTSPTTNVSIPFAMARALNNLSGWDNFTILKSMGLSDTDAAKPLTFCRRSPTSGTNAWGNVFYRQAGLSPRLAGTVDGITTVENLTSSDIRNCVHNASLAGNYAIGIISRESGAGSASGGNLPTNTSGTVAGGGRQYSFLQISGAQPDRAGTKDKYFVRNGGYENVGEATMQYRNSLSGNKLSLTTDLITALQGDDVCVNAGAVSLANEDGAAGTCEMRSTRAGDPYSPPIVRE
jgi:hypothetical protein